MHLKGHVLPRVCISEKVNSLRSSSKNVIIRHLSNYFTSLQNSIRDMKLSIEEQTFVRTIKNCAFPKTPNSKVLCVGFSYHNNNRTSELIIVIVAINSKTVFDFYKTVHMLYIFRPSAK